MKIVEFASPPGPETQIDADAIVVGRGFAPDQVINLSAVRGARHVVQRDNICYEEELALAKKMVSSPAEFFADPLRAILGCEPSPDALLIITNALTHKRDVLSQLQAFMESQSRTRSVREEVMSASDEIFTNASKNSGVFYREPADGEASVAGRIEFRAHIDENRMTIVCTDTYGLLKVEPVLQRIGAVFKTGIAGAIQNGAAGAGIGSFMIFNTCSSYYLGVDAGKKTVVGCSFQVAPRTKDKTCLSKNIHSVTIESGDRA
jgi:hypothetical protein